MTFSPNATYAANIDLSSNLVQMITTGGYTSSAALSGTTLNVVSYQNSSFLQGRNYTIMTATAGSSISGQYGNLQFNSASINLPYKVYYLPSTSSIQNITVGFPLPPTPNPTIAPSLEPSSLPSKLPSKAPSFEPSKAPSGEPSKLPSKAPSNEPSTAPSKLPSKVPSYEPSLAPSNLPIIKPSLEPTLEPTHIPSSTPTPAAPTCSTYSYSKCKVAKAINFTNDCTVVAFYPSAGITFYLKNGIENADALFGSSVVECRVNLNCTITPNTTASSSATIVREGDIKEVVQVPSSAPWQNQQFPPDKLSKCVFKSHTKCNMTDIDRNVTHRDLPMGTSYLANNTITFKCFTVTLCNTLYNKSSYNCSAIYDLDTPVNNNGRKLAEVEGLPRPEAQAQLEASKQEENAAVSQEIFHENNKPAIEAEAKELGQRDDYSNKNPPIEVSDFVALPELLGMNMQEAQDGA